MSIEQIALWQAAAGYDISNTPHTKAIPVHHPPSNFNDLNLRIVISLVFFVSLAFSARKRWLTMRELIVGGAVLVLASGVSLFDISIRTAVAEFGHTNKAYGIAFISIAPFLAALSVAIYLIAKRMKSQPPGPPEPMYLKRTRSIGKPKPSKSDAAAIDSPKPKPVRARGSKRRF